MTAAQYMSCVVAPAVCNFAENHSLWQTSYMVPSFLKGFFTALLVWLRLIRSSWDHRAGLRWERIYHYMLIENCLSSLLLLEKFSFRHTWSVSISRSLVSSLSCPNAVQMAELVYEDKICTDHYINQCNYKDNAKITEFTSLVLLHNLFSVFLL